MPYCETSNGLAAHVSNSCRMLSTVTDVAIRFYVVCELVTVVDVRCCCADD